MAENKGYIYASDDEIKSMNCKQLKDYLRRYGQYVTGNKKELIERAKGVSKLNLADKCVIECEDSVLNTKRRKEKLLTPLGEAIPDPKTLADWTSDVSHIPDFTANDVYNYLVLEKGAKRQLRSERYLEDRHVHRVEYNQISEKCSHSLVRCKVIPSLPSANEKDDPDHNVWICLSKVSGKVNSADCDCTAGTDEACNHVAALLNTLVDITVKKKDGTLASTSVKCKWNNSRKRKLSPKKAQDLKFRKTKLKMNMENNSTANFSGSDLEITKTFDVEKFKQKLVENRSNAAWLTLFERQKVQEVTVPKLQTVEYMYRDTVDIRDEVIMSDFRNIYNNLSVSHQDITNIERLTRGQSKNKQWFEARSQRITSSNFGTVMKMKKETKPDNLLRDIMGYRSFDNKYCDWGRTHEPAARRTYENSRKNIEVKQCGLTVNVKYPHLGASPDGLLLCSESNCTEKQGVLEIKCPAANRWKTEHPKTCAADPDFFCCLDENGDIRLKQTHNYYYKVQGQMAVTDRTWCDFVVWTLKGWTVERIRFDKNCWKIMSEKLDNFYVLPEVFTERVKRGRSLY